MAWWRGKALLNVYGLCHSACMKTQVSFLNRLWILC
jgi:hypothetical protein